MLLHVSERDFSSLNCCKFAVEFDWKNENSQKVHKLGFSGKLDRFSGKKNIEVYQNR